MKTLSLCACFLAGGCTQAVSQSNCGQDEVWTEGGCRPVCLRLSDCGSQEACVAGACVPTVCGDGRIEGHEECDLRDRNGDNDECTGSCRNARCGDGMRWLDEEVCDDGNRTEGDGCDSNCTVSACGNGVQAPDEACDDGNRRDGDGCDHDCTVTGCGNDIVTVGEACDDGNRIEGDGCDSNCAVSACGNDVRAPDEGCDDGNRDDGDGCDHDCTVTGCGNGIVTAGEACDDGNRVADDFCNNACSSNCPPDGCVRSDVWGPWPGFGDDRISDVQLAAEVKGPTLAFAPTGELFVAWIEGGYLRVRIADTAGALHAGTEIPSRGSGTMDDATLFSLDAIGIGYSALQDGKRQVFVSQWATQAPADPGSDGCGAELSYPRWCRVGQQDDGINGSLTNATAFSWWGGSGLYIAAWHSGGSIHAKLYGFRTPVCGPPNWCALQSSTLIMSGTQPVVRLRSDASFAGLFAARQGDGAQFRSFEATVGMPQWSEVWQGPMVDVAMAGGISVPTANPLWLAWAGDGVHVARYDAGSWQERGPALLGGHEPSLILAADGSVLVAWIDTGTPGRAPVRVARLQDNAWQSLDGPMYSTRVSDEDGMGSEPVLLESPDAQAVCVAWIESRVQPAQVFVRCRAVTADQ